MLHLRGRFPSSREVFTKLFCCSYLFSALMPLLPSLKLLSSSSSPLCPKSCINPCEDTWDPGWFVTSAGFAQPRHQWDPGNANPPCVLPTQTSVPASFSLFIFLQLISSIQPPAGLTHIQSFPHLKGMCEEKRMSSESYGCSKMFLKYTGSPPPRIKRSLS